MKNIIFCLLFLVLVSCKPQQASTAASEPQPVSTSITNTEWKLIRLNGEDVSALNPPLTLSLDAAQMKVSGFAGCNRFFGGYELNQSSLRFSAMGATKMYCQDKSPIEDKYLKALSEVQSFKSANGTLVLSGEKADLEFTK
jgi:heat shock protein HslJ